MAAGFVHVGRQPIYDRGLRVVGYELLFRAHAEARSALDRYSDDTATAQVLVNTFAEFGIASLVDRKLAFVNVPRRFLVGEMPIPFAPGAAVLEILENVPTDAEVLAGARSLVQAGHILALDDFIGEPEREPLLDLAAYVKVDVQAVDPSQLADVVNRCRRQGAKLLAEKVETADGLDRVRALGFDLFQGWHLGSPKVMTARALDPGQLACLRLLATLAREDVEFDDIEQLVRPQPALAYRLLRTANSASSATSRRISSLRDALVLLGLRQLRAWLLLMVLSDASPAGTEHLATAVIRARTCELLAESTGTASPDAAFATGLLSCLERLLRRPLREIVAHMSLSPHLRDALLTGAGPLGELLQAVCAYERDEAEGLDGRIGTPAIANAYVSGMNWWVENCSAALAG
jgi:c-di-GMP-related signal transduction protein